VVAEVLLSRPATSSSGRANVSRIFPLPVVVHDVTIAEKRTTHSCLEDLALKSKDF